MLSLHVKVHGYNQRQFGWPILMIAMFELPHRDLTVYRRFHRDLIYYKAAVFAPEGTDLNRAVCRDFRSCNKQTAVIALSAYHESDL